MVTAERLPTVDASLHARGIPFSVGSSSHSDSKIIFRTGFRNKGEEGVTWVDHRPRGPIYWRGRRVYTQTELLEMDCPLPREPEWEAEWEAECS